MNFFLLLVSFASVLTSTATPYTVTGEGAKSPDFRSLSERDILDGEATDELLWPDAIDFELSPLIFPEIADNAPVFSDQAFAVPCNGVQSNSLDPFMDLPVLDARDLFDDFSEISSFDTSLNEPDKPVCAPRSQQSDPDNSGGKEPKQDPNPILAPLIPENEQPDLEAGRCFVDGYIWPLCCNGGFQGVFVYGCVMCEYSKVPRLHLGHAESASLTRV